MDRAQKSMTQLNEQGLNCALYWENDSPDDTISLVPTSAHTGEGVPDLLSMLIKGTQDMQTEKIMCYTSLQCTADTGGEEHRRLRRKLATWCL